MTMRSIDDDRQSGDVRPASRPPLAGTTVVEAASFVAAPSAGMILAQLGADVIRVDPPGGASDIFRWPLSENGRSLFWAGLNGGKRSVTIDHRIPEGRELLLALVTEGGRGGGILLDNMVGKHRIRHEELTERRPDVIHVHLEGRRDGSPAVDYTINAETGVPLMTGGPDDGAPINHVLPAWDLIAGTMAATAITAAIVHRDRTGQGARVDLALADVALAAVGSMGWLAEAEQASAGRPRHGNYLYGSFGVDFVTADQRRVMVVALTESQWRALRDVTGTREVFAALERLLEADFDLESDRYRLRETIAAVLRPWFAQRDYAAVQELLDRSRVLWSPYLDMSDVARNARSSGSMASEIEQPGIGSMLATGRAARWDGVSTPPVPAPRLSEHTDEVLYKVLGLSESEIRRLRAAGVIGR